MAVNRDRILRPCGFRNIEYANLAFDPSVESPMHKQQRDSRKEINLGAIGRIEKRFERGSNGPCREAPGYEVSLL